MTVLYSNDNLPKTVTEPNYQVLVDWCDAWPEARPELLDFWARGGYVQRVLWRRQQKRPALSIGIQYLDEMETVLRRLALLDIEVDFIWNGDVAPPSLVMAPQDIDFEGVGGWGYMTCSGDELADRRKGREWCPSLALASLLPDTVTDWLAIQAVDYLRSGRILICPADAVGAAKGCSNGLRNQPHGFTNATPIEVMRKEIELLFTIDLPVLERMSLADLHNFCRDYSDELNRYRRAVATLLSSEPSQSAVSHKEIAAEIQDAISEITSSDKGKGMRHALTAAGGMLVSAQLVVAVNAGGDHANVALTAGGAVLAAVKLWEQKTAIKKERRKNPFWILWKLQGKEDRPLEFKKPRLVDSLSAPNARHTRTDIPRHWLAPPSGGWVIPTGFIPQA